MNETAISVVKFIDKSDKSSKERFGVLFDNGFILCFCCGGYVEPENYEIIEETYDFRHLHETLKKYY